MTSLNPKLMHAYRHRPTSDVICHELVPVPEPKAGEVLLEVVASGLCHSDVLILEHNTGYAMIDEGIFTQGHEFAGRVVKNGVSSNLTIGQLYIPIGTNPCFKCQLCNSGRDNLCTTDRPHIGSGSDGGFANYVCVRSEALVEVPDGVSAEQAAAVTDACVTPYHGIKTIGQLQAGQTIVIIGLGGLGLNACAISLMLGARCYGVDVKPAALELATKIGVTALTMAEMLAKVNEEKIAVDLVIDCFGSQRTFADGQLLLQPGGTIVVMGLEERQLPYNTIRNLTREIRATTSYWGKKSELVELLDYIRHGKLRPLFKTAPMSELPFWIEEMKAGKVTARMCFHPDLKPE